MGFDFGFGGFDFGGHDFGGHDFGGTPDFGHDFTPDFGHGSDITLFHHNPDCDTAYPTHSDNTWNNIIETPENTICNEFENADSLNDVRECLQDDKAHDVSFGDRHEHCFKEHLAK